MVAWSTKCLIEFGVLPFTLFPVVLFLWPLLIFFQKVYVITHRHSDDEVIGRSAGALRATRPTLDASATWAMPETTVQKMIGAIIIFLMGWRR